MINNSLHRKKVYLETYGCQMNEYDTELVRAILTKEGYALTSNELEADVVMLNTCAIRENAHRKVYGRIHDIRHQRNGNPALIGILGCMATNLRQDLLEDRNLKIDFIAGPDSYKRLPDLIAECYVGADPCIRPVNDGSAQKPAPTGKPYDVTLSEFETYSDIFPKQGGMGQSSSGDSPRKVNAWIAVMRGCNNFCTFCVVPYTRGRERSRSVKNVVEEAQRLADDGFKQVTLLGQNVNSYYHDGARFADLLNAVSAVEGIERIRFTSPHPKDFPEPLIQTVADNRKVCKHIHLPLQAGSSRVLDLMNRTYTREEFVELARKIRAMVPGIALTTDIIVGFSSETEDEFKETLGVMAEIEFDAAFTFKYSERKNTIAHRKLPDDIPEEVKTDRIGRVLELQRAISHRKNEAHIGQTLPVLIEALETSRSADHAQGRTDGNKTVILPKDGLTVGQTVPARITGATVNTLKGERPR